MTTTPVDMMSEAWIDKIEAETKTPEQTFKTSTKMTVKKTLLPWLPVAWIHSLLFNPKNLFRDTRISSPSSPSTKPRHEVGLLKNCDLDTCGWSATEAHFAKGSAIWNYKHNFWRMAPHTTLEEGINFTQPRMQILLRSPLMVEETKGMRQTIGTFDDPQVKELWDADKLASDLANSKGEMYTRKYQSTYKVLGIHPHSRKQTCSQDSHGPYHKRT
jgi:hypothetical protein